MVVKKEKLYSGKAKSVYTTDESDKLIVEFRDDITAFDAVKKAVIPKKGYYNAQISAKLFKLLEQNGIATHFLDMISPNEMLVKRLDMFKIEVIVRNIAAGSLVKKYGFKEGTPLEKPIITMDFKSDAQHDPMINDDIAIALHLATKKELNQIREISLKVDAALAQYLEQRNLLLPDFKIEFGKFKRKILVGDEISPDSCRFWDKATRKSLDKDVFRFDKGDLISAYEEVARRIVPEIF